MCRLSATARSRRTITGSVTIDDNGNGFGADDLISFSLTLTSPGSGAIVRSYGSSVVDKYDSMTQVLAPVAANSVTAQRLRWLRLHHRLRRASRPC